MAAIITNKFRINNAEQFVESFSETDATTYYLFVGRSHSWASDADVQGNSINEGTDASPPTPNAFPTVDCCIEFETSKIISLTL